MKYSIKILKKELKDWKEQYASDKHYYKGYYDDKEAIRAFKSDKKHIAELEKAIEVLKISSKVHVSGNEANPIKLKSSEVAVCHRCNKSDMLVWDWETPSRIMWCERCRQTDR